MVKKGGYDIAKNLVEKFKKLKIEGLQPKVIDTLYMGRSNSQGWQILGNYAR